VPPSPPAAPGAGRPIDEAVPRASAAPEAAAVGTLSRPAPPRLLLLEAACGLALAASLVHWFSGVPRALPAAVPWAALLGLVAWRLGAGGATPRLPRPRPETVACLGLATLFRLPALLHPWGWVNRDGAYGAFAALHMLQGLRPAPPFTEGANYQGTLKSHISALLALATGVRDLSWLMTASSLALYLACVAAGMALARRVGGRAAALCAGLYLALSPKFLTTFSLNCVGQYADVLALGGLALALLARLLDGDDAGREARLSYAGVGVLLGAAVWAQPVALCYVLAAALALLARRASRRDPWSLLAVAGFALGLLPVIVWNLQHEWATREIVGRDLDELRAQAGALPQLARRAVTVSFPILAGLSPGHPWSGLPGIEPFATWLLPAALAAYLAVQARPLLRALRSGRASPALLAPLLTLTCLVLFLSVAAGRVYSRPRYVLPLVAAAAVQLGVVTAWAWRRSRPAAVIALGAILALNVSGSLPRLAASAAVAEPYRRLVESLERKGIRTGYSDFSLAAPVTMFTAERIVLSASLGPTPAYESPLHAARVERDGPDAYVLLEGDDPERFAAILRSLGIAYSLDRDPVPIFHGFSPRAPRLEEVAGFRGDEATAPPPEE
jgi:hypothetical protein